MLPKEQVHRGDAEYAGQHSRNQNSGTITRLRRLM